MYQKICQGCGIEFGTFQKNQIYCSHKCANTNRGKNGSEAHFDLDQNWIKMEGKWECPYQKNVGCTIRECNKCGWNPDVAKARLDKYMEEHHEG